MIEKVLQRGMITAFLDLVEHRHERRGKRALGKDPAQVVGNAIGDDKRIHRRRHAEQTGLLHVAGKTRQPRQQRHRAENRSGTQQSGRARQRRGTHRVHPAARSAKRMMFVSISRVPPKQRKPTIIGRKRHYSTPSTGVCGKWRARCGICAAPACHSTSAGECNKR